MSISAPFIRRPIGTSLMAAALLLSGILAFTFSASVLAAESRFPRDQRGSRLARCGPATMASAVATPLERQFGRISRCKPR